MRKGLAVLVLLRLALLKLGVQVVRSVRRPVFRFPRAHPHARTWRAVAR